MSRTKRLASYVIVVLLAGATGFLIWALTSRTPVLAYYGASVDVPQGTAIAIMNPFRDRTSERTAERLIKDLRSPRCEQVLQEFRPDPLNLPSRVCPVVQKAKSFALIWLEDGHSSKTLVYNLPDQDAPLWIYFGRGEDGFGIYAVSLLH